MSRPEPGPAAHSPPVAEPMAGHGTPRPARRRQWLFRLGPTSPYRSLVLLVLAATIPTLLLGFWASYLSAQRQRFEARNKVLERVEDVTDRIASELMKHLELADALAASTALDRSDLQGFYREASRLRSTHPLWHTIELDTPSGMQVLN